MRSLSRRHFLVSSAAALSAATIPGRPIFEEIPASASGITWVHDNAKSDLHYLPETLGPGCAFLDYDNDGWMDIYLVNSGPSISGSPADQSATRSIKTTATALSQTLQKRRA